MAPDIHGLIGQNEEAAQRSYKNNKLKSNLDVFMLHERVTLSRQPTNHTCTMSGRLSPIFSKSLYITKRHQD